MATSLNLHSSVKFTDPSLRCFHKQGEAACFTLQEKLDEGFLSLTEAVTKIGSFTEKVRSIGKIYQEEKHLTVSARALQAQHAEFLEEYRGYKAVDLKAVILFENIEKTIQFIQPARRSRSDERSLQENMPEYYAELKEYEAIFTKYISQLKGTQAILSPLKHQLNAAINSKILTSALEKFRMTVENQGTYPSKSSRLLHHITPPSLPSSKRKSESPLCTSSTPSWKTLPLASIPKFQQREELLTPSPRVRLSTDSGGLNTSREITRQSPRIATSTLQPLIREAARSPRRTALTHLSGSGGNAPYRPSNSPREKYTMLSSSSSPRHLSTYESPRKIYKTPSVYVSNWDRNTSPESERVRRFHLPHNPLRKKNYENVDATSFSTSRY